MLVQQMETTGTTKGKTVAGEPEDLPAMFVDLPEGTRII
jgi:hypothetical protein